MVYGKSSSDAASQLNIAPTRCVVVASVAEADALSEEDFLSICAVGSDASVAEIDVEALYAKATAAGAAPAVDAT